MTYIIDTNILVRVFINDDQDKHDACVRLLSSIKENKLTAVLPDIVLSEMVWLLQSFYGVKKKQIVQVIKATLSTNGLTIINSYDYFKAINLYETTKAKYIDCLIATLATDKNWTIVSDDKDFDLLKVKRVTPEELTLTS